MYYSTNNSYHLPTHFLTYVPKYVVSDNGNMCHFSLDLHFNPPFHATMMFDGSFILIVSSQNFIIPFRGVRKTCYPRKPWQKPITIVADKQDISLLIFNPSVLHSVSHPSNKSIIVSLVTLKSCFLIIFIRSSEPLINLWNHGHLVGHAVSMKFSPSVTKMVSPIPSTRAPYILAHAFGPFLVLFHYRCPTYLPFLSDILKITQATPIPI